MEAYAGGHVYIKYKLLQALLNLLKAHIVVIYKGRAVGVKGGPCLGPGCFALGSKGRINYLTQERTQMLGRLALHLIFHSAEAI